MKFENHEAFVEFVIVQHGVAIGEATVNISYKALDKLIIYPPYRNERCVKKIVKKLIERYDIKRLWAVADDPKAVRAYEKCGFKKDKKKNVAYRMIRDD